VHYKVSDGDRVSAGDTVATVSPQQISAENRLAAENIDRQISILSDCISATTQFDVKTLDTQTKQAINDYLSVTSARDISDSKDTADRVLSYFVKRDIKAKGDKSYYQQILQNCEATRKTLLSGSSAQQSGVYASEAGYFSSQHDGFEGYSSSKFETVTPEDVKELLSATPTPRPEGYVGKLQHFSYWTYLCTVPEAKAEIFTENSSWTLRFDTPAYGIRTVTMRIISKSDPVEGEVALVFESSSFSKEIYSLRNTPAEIILNSYKGYKVDKDAVRVSEGKTGVYVLSGAKVVFKPVDVLYRDEVHDFAVVSSNTKATGRILITNDSVVIGGKEIYDGKVVKTANGKG
ncbi:MAG: hypothetical protein II348_05580, partial [Clostridia bacterium]|nr:hypothetical protein [Clostridia bacterium]